MPEPLLEFRGVRAAYEEVEVIHGIDATFEEGAVTAVLGANGAGKSTLLSLAVGVMGPSEGEVRFAGEKVRVGSTSSLARQGLCLIPEGRGVFPNLTVRENLWVMTHSGQGRRHVERSAFERFPRLEERRDQHAGTLSGGEQQMLALARAVATSPRLLLLDELSMGLAPLVVEELYRHVVSLAAEGITVVVVEQFARMALSVASLGHGDGERADHPDRSGRRGGVGAPVCLPRIGSASGSGITRAERGIGSPRPRHGRPLVTEGEEHHLSGVGHEAGRVGAVGSAVPQGHIDRRVAVTGVTRPVVGQHPFGPAITEQMEREIHARAEPPAGALPARPSRPPLPASCRQRR